MLFIFDMGGVVTTTAGQNLYEKVSKKLGISLENFLFLMGWNTKNNLFFEIEKGTLSVAEWWKIFEERSKIKICCDWFRLLFHPVLNEETKKIVLELKSKGHRVVCGTNTIESHYDNHKCRGDYEIFDMTYASIHMSVRKPDVDFWKLILECENEIPENTFFTDDKKENCDAARMLGVKTYNFKSANELRKNLENWL